jgi:hypothetical protein
VKSASSVLEAPVVRGVRRDFAAVDEDVHPETIVDPEMYGHSAEARSSTRTHQKKHSPRHSRMLGSHPRLRRGENRSLAAAHPPGVVGSSRHPAATGASREAKGWCPLQMGTQEAEGPAKKFAPATVSTHLDRTRCTTGLSAPT